MTVFRDLVIGEKFHVVPTTSAVHLGKTYIKVSFLRFRQIVEGKIHGPAYYVDNTHCEVVRGDWK